MNDFPVLQTARLTLRQHQLCDIPALLKYVNHRAITDQILNFPFPYREADAVARLDVVWKGFAEGWRYTFAITRQGDNELMGEMGLSVDLDNDRAEMGYWIGEPFWGQGYMSEVVAATLQFAFEELKLHKVFATHFIDNPASGRVLVKMGMVKEAEFKDHYKGPEGYRDVAQYRLTRGEYSALTPK